ncbi:hypothetical protein CI610_01314 [invertebrate metagenome]|uniref:Uncharacterized protein n=1 Tax=invertebrate metagenome TaxID=1711999 RepID=A0A2H9T8Z9_9ZZZZ
MDGMPENNRDIQFNRGSLRTTGNDPELGISAEESTEQQTDSKKEINDLKNMMEGLREHSLLNPELQMLVSSVISQLVPAGEPHKRFQNISTDSRFLSVDGVESPGPANSYRALRQMQDIFSRTSPVLQQLMDYLSLSGTSRKDDLLNPGLEYEQLMTTVNSFIARMKNTDALVKAHIQESLDKEGLREQMAPEIQYLDPALIVIERSLQLEIARMESEK